MAQRNKIEVRYNKSEKIWEVIDKETGKVRGRYRNQISAVRDADSLEGHPASV